MAIGLIATVTSRSAMLKGGDCVHGKEKIAVELFSADIAKNIWRQRSVDRGLVLGFYL
jgi:hypothetical protein